MLLGQESFGGKNQLGDVCVCVGGRQSGESLLAHSPASPANGVSSFSFLSCKDGEPVSWTGSALSEGSQVEGRKWKEI